MFIRKFSFVVLLVLTLQVGTSIAGLYGCIAQGAATLKFFLQMEQQVKGAEYSNLKDSVGDIADQLTKLKNECGENFDINFAMELFKYEDCAKNMSYLFQEIVPLLSGEAGMFANLRGLFQIYSTIGQTLKPCGITIGAPRPTGKELPSGQEL